MSHLKAKTESGVVFNAPLKTKSDYQRAINFLQKEMEIAEKSQQNIKKSVQKKGESPELKNFLEGVNI